MEMKRKQFESIAKGGGGKVERDPRERRLPVWVHSHASVWSEGRAREQERADSGFFFASVHREDASRVVGIKNSNERFRTKAIAGV